MSFILPNIWFFIFGDIATAVHYFIFNKVLLNLYPLEHVTTDMDLLTDGDATTGKPHNGISTVAKLLIAATGGVGLGLSIVCASFVAPAFRKICLPYVPATNEQIANVLKFLPKDASGKLLDIGSGDGRIVIAAAKHAKNLNANGVELNRWLVYYSRLAALRLRMSHRACFFKRDLWKFNISSYNYVIIFGVEQMMRDLEHKLLTESPFNVKIIACRFALPHLHPVRVIEDGVNTVWFYELDKSHVNKT